MQLSSYFPMLQASETSIIDFARTLSADELSRKEGDCWSALEVLEHMLLTEKLIITFLQKPAAEEHESETIHGNEKLHHMIVNKRAFKIVAPDFLHPTGRFKTLEEFESAFRSQRAELVSLLQHGTIALNNRIYPHPTLGKLTAIDWLYFLIHHSGRHLEQMKEAAAV